MGCNRRERKIQILKTEWNFDCFVNNEFEFFSYSGGKNTAETT